MHSSTRLQAFTDRRLFAHIETGDLAQHGQCVSSQQPQRQHFPSCYGIGTQGGLSGDLQDDRGRRSAGYRSSHLRDYGSSSAHFAQSWLGGGDGKACQPGEEMCVRLRHNSKSRKADAPLCLLCGVFLSLSVISIDHRWQISFTRDGNGVPSLSLVSQTLPLPP